MTAKTPPPRPSVNPRHSERSEESLIKFFEWITTLKAKIRSARNKLAFSINSQVIELYYKSNDFYRFHRF